MTRGYVWFGVLGVCGCCATIANALIVYDNSGVHEVSTPVFDDIHVLDGLYTGPYDSFVEILDNATITLVPEPTALGLLGLGILFIRRKRNGGRMPQ